MSEVEGNGDPGDPVRREPFLGQPAMRPKSYPLELELAVQTPDGLLQFRAANGQFQIAETQAEQLIVGQRLPGMARCASQAGRPRAGLCRLAWGGAFHCANIKPNPGSSARARVPLPSHIRPPPSWAVSRRRAPSPAGPRGPRSRTAPVRELRARYIADAGENRLDAAGEFFLPFAQHALHHQPLHIGLRAAQGAGMMGNCACAA